MSRVGRCNVHIELILIMNGVLRFIFYFILLSAFVGQYFEYTNMHSTNNIKCIEAVVPRRIHRYAFCLRFCNSTATASVE